MYHGFLRAKCVCVYILIQKIPMSHYRTPVSERRGFKCKSRGCLKIGVLLKMQRRFSRKKVLISPIRIHTESFKRNLVGETLRSA